ncbi:Fc.00g021130.m01.CDS01 [Cosmosporella sp. VM-42]
MSRAQNADAQVQYDVPHINNDDLFAFHEAHFSKDAAALFGGAFMNLPRDQETHDDPIYEQWEEEDDLGYYEDGVKRTLTDEQIEIFRHSELEALRKEQEKQSNKTPGSSDEARDLSDSKSAQLKNAMDESSSRSKKKGRKGKKKAAPPRQPKPDLRKRTWDVVEKGLDSLDYD